MRIEEKKGDEKLEETKSDENLDKEKEDKIFFMDERLRTKEEGGNIGRSRP